MYIHIQIQISHEYRIILPYSRRFLINVFNKSFIYPFSKHLPPPLPTSKTCTPNVRISVPFNFKILSRRIPREIMREYYKELRHVGIPLPPPPLPRENNRNGRSRGASSCVFVSIDHASLPPNNFHNFSVLELIIIIKKKKNLLENFVGKIER